MRRTARPTTSRPTCFTNSPLIDLEKSLGFPLPVLWQSVKVGAGECLLEGTVLGVEEPVQRHGFEPRARYLR